MSSERRQEILSEYLEYREGELVMEAFLAWDKAPIAKRPCIIIAHDWSGQNDGTRRVARRVAALGYIAFALDVYGKGIRGNPVGDNTALMRPLMEDRRLLRGRLLAASDAARGHPRVDQSNLAAIGHCFGGLCALDLARAAPEGLRGVVSFHGALKAPPFTAERPIGARILLLHGWEDPIVPQSDVLAAAKEFTEAGADWQLHAYGHARHAFTFRGANIPEHGILYDAKADRRSWAAMQAFLQESFTDATDGAATTDA